MLVALVSIYETAYVFEARRGPGLRGLELSSHSQPAGFCTASLVS
jgi:hypothetical protein